MSDIGRSEGHWTLWIDPETMATTVSPGHGWDDTPGRLKVEVVHRDDLRGVVEVAARVVETWDAWMDDPYGDNGGTWRTLRDAVEALRPLTSVERPPATPTATPPAETEETA